MPTLIDRPVLFPDASPVPIRIEEYVGRLTTKEYRVSVARLMAPEGWSEPGQRPEFEEITIVLRGMVRIEHAEGAIDVHAGQAAITWPNEWIRYSTPNAEGADYVAVCLPAFSLAMAYRDE